MTPPPDDNGTPDADRDERECSSAPTIVERIRGQGERVHVPLGAICNNNCVFCMEDDREARRVVQGAMHDDRVRWVLREHVGAEEVCFTSGEPTLHPRLAAYVRWARDLGYARVSVMTNGRRLSYPPYAESLVRAGLNRVYVSVHGHQATVHDRMTRTPGSFDQTVAGLRAVAAWKRSGLTVHTSTVLTRRNVDVQLEIYEFLTDLGVDQVVFNALQVTGRAARLVDILVPRYIELRRGFQRVVDEARDRGCKAFLVDAPLCVTHGLPDANRGWFERHVHYEVPLEPDGPTPGSASQPVQRVQTSDLDQLFREHGPPCASCAYRPVCPGVFSAYVTRFGWDEFVPATATPGVPRP